MYSTKAVNYITNKQDALYKGLNDLSKSHKTLGRLCSLPVSLADVAMDTLKVPLNVIESVAMVAINLIGKLFSNKYSVKHAILHADSAICSFPATPAKLLMAPIKFAYQFFAIALDPVNVKRTNSLN